MSFCLEEWRNNNGPLVLVNCAFFKALASSRGLWAREQSASLHGTDRIRVRVSGSKPWPLVLSPGEPLVLVARCAPAEPHPHCYFLNSQLILIRSGGLGALAADRALPQGQDCTKLVPWIKQSSVLCFRHHGSRPPGVPCLKHVTS